MHKHFFIFVALATLVLVVFHFGKRKHKANPLSKSVAAQSIEPVSKKPKATIPVRLDQQSSGEVQGLNAAQLRSRTELIIGVRRTSLPQDGDGHLLTVKLFTESGCLFGDLNVIRMDMSANPSSSLALTVEPLVPGAFEPLSKRVTVADIEKGYSTNFRLPGVSKLTPAAVYLCRDSNGTGRCSGKEPIDYKRPTWEVTSSKAQEVDRIFFFSYLGIDEGGAQALASNVISNSGYETMRLYLAKEGGDKTRADEAVSKIQAINGKLSSKGAAWSGSTLLVNLPQRVEKQCPD